MFVLAVALAVFFHLAFLFFVKDIQIDLGPHKPLIENRSVVSSDESFLQKKQEQSNRQKQLAEVLNQLTIGHVPEPRQEDEIVEHIPHQLSMELDLDYASDKPSLEEPKGLSEENMSIEKSLQPPLLAATLSKGDELQSSKFLRRPTPMEILFPDDEYLVDELIMATEMAHGKLAPETTEDLLLQNAIKAGVEESQLDGQTMKNRSGLLDTPQAKFDTGSGGSFNLSSAIGNWNYAVMRQSPNFESREVLLPKYNKDELRGFDYKSLGSIASSNDFNLTVEYAPRKEGGYLFRLALTPKPDIKFKHIKQNYFFLIDRSHSIRFNRYELTKVAVAKALALLQKGDTFNVLVFDDAIVRLSPGNLLWNAPSISLARSFIQQQEYGGLFANTDLYSSLGMIIPNAVAENEVNTAILLSDGDTFLNSDKQRVSIGSWTEKNAGKVSLHVVASGRGNNLALLDILSVLNKGSLHYSSTDKGLENVLFRLLRSIRNPIGKDITTSVLPSAPDTVITLYPEPRFLANLYENTPYVVYGVINQLKDFHIFFQGKYYDKLLDIKQEVSFKKAAKIDSEVLEKKIAMQKAYIAYNNYLREGNQAYLHEVKQLLGPYRLPIAFK